MMEYNFLDNSFTTFEGVETPRKVYKDYPLGGFDFSTDLVQGITPSGTPVVADTTNSENNNYQEIIDKMSESHSEEIPDDIQENNGQGYMSGTYGSNYKEKKGNKQLLIDTINKINSPEISKIKGFLLDTAALESGFIHNITSNKSTGSGWFGFLDSTKKQFAPGTTRAQFNNSPEIQVKAAAKLYYTHLKTAQRLGMIDAAKKKGYTTDDVIHAMWLNPTWAKNFFLYGQEGGKDALGTNIRKYLNRIHGGK